MFGEILNYWQNFLQGLRLLLGAPVNTEKFRYSFAFIACAFLLSLMIFAGIDYRQQHHEIYFNINGAGLLGTYYFFATLTIGVIAHLQQDTAKNRLLVTVVLSCLPWLAVLISLFPYPLAYAHTWVMPMLMGYFTFVVIRTLGTVYRPLRWLSVVVAVTAVWLVAVTGWKELYYPSTFLSYDASEYEEFETQDVESIFYRQQALMQNKLAALAPSTDGETDYYFLGFASSVQQTVFETEIHYAEEVMNRHFGTENKSIVLYNNENNLETEPLANRHNLKTALLEIGRKINPLEDVVILLLTSHGSENAQLSVDLWPLPLQPLSVEDFKSYLDESKIKWRVIIISACFSGSFIDQLANKNTLLITAAAADKSSFGCSSDRQLTVFGEAYLEQSLAHNGDFIAAFEQAKILIAKWESENEEGLSNPQISIGSEILEKLNSGR